MNVSRSNREGHLVLEQLAADRATRPAASSCRGRRVQQADTHQHLAMVQAYQRTGGLVTCDEAAMLLGRHREQPISVLARWIVARDVLSFVWQAQTLLPLFQFDIADMTLRRGAREVIAELAGAFDDLDLAAWFASPNCWLGNAAPLVMIETNQPAVLQAARADRYLARG